ncbi:type II secretion system F family protein [Candidatus Magnetaquicoccus inordinatus]|uniref:type II secretion system F family protein n=1 Tax=Candidatus Magnetaquicoccus inordinatus TaxID=2496818 RepID=UPI00102B69A2|nr:type II secretion system F family protein [Candidatus Magnetaquicoccus inordinatus]
MPLFRYTARNPHDLISGTLQAADSASVAHYLLNNMMEPLTIEEVAEKPLLWQTLSSLLPSQPNLDEMILFSRQLAALTQAGVPIIRSLQTIREHAHHPRMNRALESIIEHLNSGRDLTSAVAQHPQIFGPVMPRLIHIGEQTGRLDSAFEQIHTYLQRDRDSKRRLQTALRYPLLVLFSALLTLLVVNAFVIPTFAKMFARFGADLPLLTRMLIASSQFIQQSWPWLLALFLACLLALPVAMRNLRIRRWWDRQKLQLPLVGNLIQRTLLARLSRTFAMAQRSGLTVTQTLDMLEETLDNHFLVQQLSLMRTSVQEGESLTQAAHRTLLFPPMVLQMIAVGEQSGKLDELLQEVALFYDREVEYELQALNTLLEPLLLAIVAVVVLILALGIFLPMWNLGSVALGRR